jgi:hypothetical protein
MLRLTALLSLLVSVLPRAARAEGYELGFASGTRWMGSKSIDTLSASDDHGVVGLVGGARLRGLRPLGFDIYVDGDYQHGSVSGTTYQRIDADLSLQSLRAGARLERNARSWLTGYVRVAVGYTTGSLSISDQLSSLARPTRDRAHAATSAVAVGTHLLILRGSRLTLALRAELEYEKASALHFEAAPDTPDEDLLTIPTMSASLGDVDVSGVGLRFGLIGRF